MNKTIQKKIAPKGHKLDKCPNSIKGFEEIKEGGLPKKWTTEDGCLLAVR